MTGENSKDDLLSNINSKIKKIIDVAGNRLFYSQELILDFLTQCRKPQGSVNYEFFQWIERLQGLHHFSESREFTCYCGLSFADWQSIIHPEPFVVSNYSALLLKPGSICTLKSVIDNFMESINQLGRFQRYASHTSRKGKRK